MKISHFIPGETTKTFTTKSGKEAVIRNPRWETLPQMLDHINTMSAENTFIRFSGEQLTLEEEAKFLSEVFVKMELGKSVFQHCFIGEELVGVCEVSKNDELKERGKHVARFGLIISKEYRGEGIGYELAKTTIEEAKKRLSGLKLIMLECFASNIVALNLYKKLGFEEVGKFPKMLLHKGEYLDEIHMALKIE